MARQRTFSAACSSAKVPQLSLHDFEGRAIARLPAQREEGYEARGDQHDEDPGDSPRSDLAGSALTASVERSMKPGVSSVRLISPPSSRGIRNSA